MVIKEDIVLTQFALAVGKALLLHAAVLAKAVRTGVLLMQFALAVGKALLHRAAGLTKAMRIYTINYNKVRTLQVNMNELTLAEHKKGSRFSRNCSHKPICTLGLVRKTDLPHYANQQAYC